MSDHPSRLPARPSLEQLRKQAKELLRDYHARDIAAAERFHAISPRLADPAQTKDVTLADVHDQIVRLLTEYEKTGALAFKHATNVRLFSRNRLPQNTSYPSVVEAIVNLPVHDAILDGEATGVWGKPGKVVYHVFDILWLEGRDVTKLRLDARRALLSELPLRPPLQRVESLEHPKPLEYPCNKGWEGVIAKRRDSLYEHRRSKHWLKMKCEATQELVVGGFTDPQGGRVGLGALLVGYFEGDDFVFAGKVGTGFDTNLLLDLRAAGCDRDR